MKIVIDIPDDAYNILLEEQRIPNGLDLEYLVMHGTPLPKGHGSLVDYEELKNNAREYGAYVEATLSHIKPKTIIEADKEGE